MKKLAQVAMETIEIYQNYRWNLKIDLRKPWHELDVCVHCGDTKLNHAYQSPVGKEAPIEICQNQKAKNNPQKIFKKDLEKSRALLAMLRVMQ